ncbi:SDR family oxidoreductase [Legionella sp. MW5194]|uniref:SDR family NAD(P)-dependent oxidoreductase n=1 Tax=Legionella sp. MW5194 TaxID=2662448 RepID=UPI00193E0BC7|nr:SDR family oxidoreductase [Legionella sp. MW5194]QRN04024.1 SDR family oxidoreductase [Legionella sp. MW5194]
MNNEKQLQHKRALITGGNGGLGLGMARALKEAGAQVMIWGRDEAKLEKADEEGFMTAKVDLNSQQAIAEGFKQLVHEFSGLDILINNAGIYEDQQITTLSREAWDRFLSNNLTSVFLCSQQAARLMKMKKQGKIINLGSMYSLFGHPHSIGYTTTKTAILGLTRALAAELGPWNIQVNAILPGWFETAINGSLPQSERGEEIKKRTPLGRWGQSPDIGPLAVFLSSSGSDFITGTAIPIDGGYSISDRAMGIEE